jgi:hypothetical protein
VVLTLADARATFLDHLDDDGTRWSTTQVDRALSLGLVQTLDDYASGGGDRFDLVESLTSTSGVVDMSTKLPISIRGISALVGTRYFPIRTVAIENRMVPDTVTRTLQVRYTRGYTLPTNSAHPLVGVGATGANSWDTFDHWVCVRAALMATTKDFEKREDLLALEQQLAGSVMTINKIPGARPFPSTPKWYSTYIVWAWNRSLKQILVCRVW